MVWPAIVGAVGAVAGGFLASKGAGKAAEAQSKASEAEVQFAQQQYADWLEVFGPIQENLSNYYQRLTPDFIEAQELQAFEQEFTQTLGNIEQELAVRGLESSGISKDLIERSNFDRAVRRAEIRADAPLKSAREQRDFLQIGKGLNPASSVQEALSNQTQLLSDKATSANISAQNAVGAAVDTTFNTLEELFSSTSNNSFLTGAPIGNPDETEASRTA